VWCGVVVCSLYELESSSPVLMWSHVCAGGVRSVSWSPARPALFFALDHTRTVHVFDLAQSTQAPHVTCPLPAASDLLAVSARIGAGPSAVGARTGFVAFGSSRQAAVAVSAVEVHVIAPAYSQASESERKRLAELLEQR
jgi:hypothetical protein